jgi:hypothetical protein
MNWNGKFVLLPREQTSKHLLQSGNAAQHVVANYDRIRTGRGYEEPLEIEEAIRRTIAWEQQNPPSTVNPQQFDYSAEDAALANAPCVPSGDWSTVYTEVGYSKANLSVSISVVIWG